MQDHFFHLSMIGTNEDVYGLLGPYATRGLVLGRVSVVHREQYWIYTAEGEMKAEAIGALLYRAVGGSEWAAIRRPGASCRRCQEGAHQYARHAGVATLGATGKPGFGV
jgi:hypothetical protein